MRIENLSTIKRIASYILLAIQRDKIELPVSEMIKLQKTWIKRPEKFKEILRTPTEVYYNGKNGLGGDCDDYVTLIARIAYHNKLKFKLCFSIINGVANHIYPEVYYKNRWIDFDAWNKKNKKYKKLCIDSVFTGSFNGQKVRINL